MEYKFSIFTCEHNSNELDTVTGCNSYSAGLVVSSSTNHVIVAWNLRIYNKYIELHVNIMK